MVSYEAAQARFAERIDLFRHDKQMTKKDFCALIGISVSNYDYYVGGYGMPNLYTAMVIAEALDVTLDQLLGIKRKDKNNG